MHDIPGHVLDNGVLRGRLSSGRTTAFFVFLPMVLQYRCDDASMR